MVKPILQIELQEAIKREIMVMRSYINSTSLTWFVIFCMLNNVFLLLDYEINKVHCVSHNSHNGISFYIRVFVFTNISINGDMNSNGNVLIWMVRNISIQRIS